MEPELKQRKAAANWREHLRETRESLQIVKWVWKNLISDDSRRYAKRMLVFSFVAILFGLMTPWMMRGLIDGVIARQLSPVVWNIAGLAGFWLLSVVFDWLLMRTREYVWGHNVISVDTETAGIFFRKSLGQHLSDSSSLSAGNLEKGRHKVYGLAELLLFNGVDGIVRIVLCLGFIWFLSPVAGAVASLVLVNNLLWSVILNHRTVSVMAPVDYGFRKLERRRFELWEKIERVVTSGKQAEETADLNQRVEGLILQDRKHWLWFINTVNYRGLIEIVCLTAIVAYGTWRVWGGFWTVGLLYPLMTWTNQFVQNLWRIGHVERQLNNALPSIRSLKRVLELEPDIVDGPEAIELDSGRAPQVSFEGVDHVYSREQIKDDGYMDEEERPEAGQPQPILEGVSFTVEPGEKVALIGPSGIGKTTVMRLLQRYFDPVSGRIAVDGHDLRQVGLASWRRLVSYISQQPQVIDGTIRSNLLYSLIPEERDKVSDEQLWATVRRLKIDFGDRLTNGLDTKVGPRGIKLSGGEQQRLMIGAAAMKRPKFWIIDEATSSLDSSTEKEVQAGLAEVMEEGHSALVIAHRLSTVRNCDKFVVLSKNGLGSRVEAVAHSFEELYDRCPTFRQLADDQDLAIERPGPSRLGKQASGSRNIPRVGILPT